LSRSWERKVRKNMSQLNKKQKKQGGGPVIVQGDRAVRHTGRNYFAPILLLLFVALYNVLMFTNPAFEPDAMHWIIVACYIGLSALFFFRRPYLAIGKDYVQSRRFTGDKRLTASDIKEIKTQSGYVFIVPNKGASWGFSRFLNRYDTDEMAAQLKSFAEKNRISIDQQ
jgi:hypothetical protein